MALKRHTSTKSAQTTAMLFGIAVVVVFACILAVPLPGLAGNGTARTLAAELLIAQGDLARLSEQDHPPAHMAGLRARIHGALGALPWMLRRQNDTTGADALRPWQNRTLETHANRARLRGLLQELSARHPLNQSYFNLHPSRPSIRREAASIHRSYCAGCHDDAGQGDPDIELPARNLFMMALRETPEVFLARLINGVKGDETLGFANPLNDTQIAALWRFYLSPQRDAER